MDMGGGDTSDAAVPDFQLPVPEEVQMTETPVSAQYWPLGVEQGVVDPDENLRALITFPLRNQSELIARIARMYDPAASEFRKIPERHRVHGQLCARPGRCHRGE